MRCGGKLFHTAGPAAAKALSAKVLWVRVTTHVRLSVERSRRSRVSVHVIDMYVVEYIIWDKYMCVSCCLPISVYFYFYLENEKFAKTGSHSSCMRCRNCLYHSKVDLDSNIIYFAVCSRFGCRQGCEAFVRIFFRNRHLQFSGVSVCDKLSHDVTSVLSLSVFGQRLRTFLLHHLYPDLLIWPTEYWWGLRSNRLFIRMCMLVSWWWWYWWWQWWWFWCHFLIMVDDDDGDGDGDGVGGTGNDAHDAHAVLLLWL